MTPIEKLEDAVQVFVAETGAKGALSSWVLGYETTSILVQEGVQPLSSNIDYTLGMATTMAAGMGVARAVVLTLDDEFIQDKYRDDDDE